MYAFLAIFLSVSKMFFLLITLGLLFLITILFIECLASLLPSKTDRSHNKIAIPRPRIAILVPAHNEELGIAQTLKTLLPQLTTQDQLVVIADNCSDRTAQICRNFEVTVLERFNQQNKGKGYALDYGLQFLTANPPEVVIVFDADCSVNPGSVDKLAKLAMLSGRPVQPINILSQPAQANPKSIISALAFMVKNLVRPSGLHTLGLPCLLTMGTAFPWLVISQAPIATGNIVEDMQLGIDLAIAGTSPLFCPEAKVTGVLPQKEQAANSQKTRWIHGHLQTLLTQVPRLIQAAITQGRLELLAIALDLCVPPLSLLVIVWLINLMVGILIGILQQEWAIAILALIEGLLIFTAIIGAWAKFARNDIPLKTLLSIPFYLLWKIPIYLAFFIKPQQAWVRTERDADVNQLPNLASIADFILPKTFALSSKIRAAKEQVFLEIANEAEAILLHVQSGSYYSLNEVGAYIWALIQEPRTIGDLYDLIITEYAVTPEACLRDLLLVLEQLSTKELIEISNDFAA
jgi:cellulose synthase/poly-beta-1,6-N-acetylglucosamine synthase-like glycosyltransferase